jgi:hypothetical protein
MPDKMVNQEDVRLTFSDEDFQRRYSPDKAAPAASGMGHPSPTATPQTQHIASRIGRSRNKFMRTLLRRRLASSG